MVPLCGTDLFTRSFLPVVVRMWNLLLSHVFSCGTLSPFKSAKNLYLQKALFISGFF